MFAQQIRKTIEVYVDDMLVRNLRSGDHLAHLSEMFDILHKYGMKFNPNKCASGVSSGKFLEFMVNQYEIEANLDKIKAVLEMEAYGL